MSETIIPFPRAPGPIDSPERELAKLAALIHARAVRAGKPSSYAERLQDCERAAREVFADWKAR